MKHVGTLTARPSSPQCLCFCLSSLLSRSHSAQRTEASTGTSYTGTRCPSSLSLLSSKRRPLALPLSGAPGYEEIGRNDVSCASTHSVAKVKGSWGSQAIPNSNQGSWAHSTPWWLTWGIFFTQRSFSVGLPQAFTDHRFVHSITGHSRLTNMRFPKFYSFVLKFWSIIPETSISLPAFYPLFLFLLWILKSLWLWLLSIIVG